VCPASDATALTYILLRRASAINLPGSHQPEHLFIDFHIFHNRLSKSLSPTPTQKVSNDRKPIETIHLPPKEKKNKEELTT
jgi:hypothetical protein